jgi:hypothetical protein
MDLLQRLVQYFVGEAHYNKGSGFFIQIAGKHIKQIMESSKRSEKLPLTCSDEQVKMRLAGPSLPLRHVSCLISVHKHHLKREGPTKHPVHLDNWLLTTGRIMFFKRAQQLSKQQVPV